MSVYFIQVGRYFKIGYSEDPQRRFDRLHQSGTRYTFPTDASWHLADRVLYKVIEGDQSIEWAIHTAVSDFGVGLEWFLDEPLLRAFIDGLPTHVDRRDIEPVERPGGWCEREFHAVQGGRADREVARFVAKRAS